MTDPAIEVAGLSKLFRQYHERNQSLKAAVLRGGRSRYDAKWALRDVSFAVEPGSTFGLIGDNGSGKSTLLKCLARILVPDEGGLHVRGKLAALLELGSGFHPELTGRQNVFLNGAILGMSRAELEKRFDAIVDFAGIDEAIDQPVKNYSSGMYVRLGFAIATNVNADVLLVDEVLAVGDANFQRKCMERIDELRRSGATIVVVSHSADSIRNLCDQVAWLDRGQLVEVGPSAEVVPRYLRHGVEERRATQNEEDRSGGGQILIDAVHLVDRHGSSTTKVTAGEPATLRLHYRVVEPVPPGAFGAAIRTSPGNVLVWGGNTGHQGLPLDDLPREGVMEWHTPALPLHPGVYDVDVSATDRSTAHVYDYRQYVLRFDVQPSDRMPGSGVVDLGGSWALSTRSDASSR